MKKVLQFIASIMVPLLAGSLGSLFTVSKIADWYQFLNKPSFNPPNWIFAPVWNILYILMGIALFLVIRSVNKYRKKAIYIFFAQLVINITWSLVFFSLESPLWAFVTIIVLWILIWINISYFYKVSKAAGWLLVPYLFWVSFAAVLNYAILILN